MTIPGGPILDPCPNCGQPAKWYGTPAWGGGTSYRIECGTDCQLPATPLPDHARTPARNA